MAIEEFQPIHGSHRAIMYGRTIGTDSPEYAEELFYAIAEEGAELDVMIEAAGQAAERISAYNTGAPNSVQVEITRIVLQRFGKDVMELNWIERMDAANPPKTIAEVWKEAEDHGRS